MSKSQPGGMRALLRWYDQLRQERIKTLMERGFSPNLAMQKIDWDIT